MTKRKGAVAQIEELALEQERVFEHQLGGVGAGAVDEAGPLVPPWVGSRNGRRCSLCCARARPRQTRARSAGLRCARVGAKTQEAASGHSLACFWLECLSELHALLSSIMRIGRLKS